jgi:glucosamine--fructose-6-phosphate aminotransferase (isomerizing)
MTELMKDILKEPQELASSLAYALGPGRAALQEAARIINSVRHVYITGIGSSWHAGMAVLARFNSAGRPACLVEASELLHFTEIAPDAAVIVLSRSGKSVEIVRLLGKAEERKAKIIGITNTPQSPLAQAADITLNLNAAFDHLVSITMYSALALVGSLLAGAASNTLDDSVARSLNDSLSATQEALNPWRREIEGNKWFARDAPIYFLARGGSLASCHEARLLWEEAAKAPATAMTTGGFRHGPQEIMVDGLHFGIWIDSQYMRDQDLVLARDVRKLGGKVLLIGQNIPSGEGDVAFSLPKVPGNWQFLIDIIPAQLAAEYLSRLRGVNCDSFQICPYIVENEGGLAG